MTPNERGQMTMEMILLMTVLMSMSVLVTRTIRQQDWAASLVGGPWQPVRGMIENGVWQGNQKKAKAYHPSSFTRVTTPEGNEVPPP